MKNFYLLLILILLGYSKVTNAQVGIGTPVPNSSAQLDIESTNKGVLIPRVALKSSLDALTITSGNVESLLVYNTGAASDLLAGFYFWQGAEWKRLVDAKDPLLLEVLTTATFNSESGVLTYTDEDGQVNALDLTQMISNFETQTTLVYDGPNKTLTYNGEDGVPNVINLVDLIGDTETLTTLIDNGDGSLTYTDENGAVNTVAISASGDNITVTNIDIDGDGVADNVTLQEFIDNITNIVALNETQTTLVYDGPAKTLTYTGEDGEANVINLIDLTGDTETLTVLTDNGDGSVTYTDENGDANTVTISAQADNITVTNIDIDGDGVADNVTLQEFIDNITNIVALNETQTTLVYDGSAKTLTYTGEDGEANVINLIDLTGDTETLTALSISTNNNGTPADISDDFDVLTYTDEDGVANEVSLASINMYNTDGTLTGNRTIAQKANTISFTSTASTNAFSVKKESSSKTTLSVDTSTERVGIGTTVPSSALQVMGLPVYVDNTAAFAAGLTKGAFYLTGNGTVKSVF